MRKLFLILFLIGLNHFLFAQEGTLWYFNPKLGPAGWPEEWLSPGFPKQTTGGLLIGAEIGIIRSNHIFSSSFLFGGPLSPGGNDPSEIKIIDLSYGRYLGQNEFRFTYQGGLGVMYGDEIINERVSQFTTICIPLECGIRLLSSCFGIGIDLQTNLNTKHLYFAALLSLEFGKLNW